MKEKEEKRDSIIDQLTQELGSTSEIAQNLVQEMKDNGGDFSGIKSELKNLRENVRGLSSLIREGQGDAFLVVITKIALLEQRIETMERWVSSQRSAHFNLRNEVTAIKETMKGMNDKAPAEEEEPAILPEDSEPPEGRDSSRPTESMIIYNEQRISRAETVKVAIGVIVIIAAAFFLGLAL